MTTVRVSVIGEDMTSVVEGVGKEELKKAVDKFQDGLRWKLIVESKASLKTSNIAGENLFYAPATKSRWAQFLDKLYTVFRR